MIFNDKFLGTKIFLLNRIKLARVAPCFLNHEFVRAFWRCRIQRTLLLFLSLVRSGFNHRWCELQGLGVS